MSKAKKNCILSRDQLRQEAIDLVKVTSDYRVEELLKRMKNLHKPGDKIGSRILIDEIECNKWSWKCTNCGNEGVGILSNLKQSKTCAGCKISPPLRKSGDKIGSRILIEKLKHGKWSWKCTNCGNEGVGILSNLKQSKSCMLCKNKFYFFGKFMSLNSICEVFGISKQQLSWEMKNTSLEEAVFYLSMAKLKLFNGC